MKRVTPCEGAVRASFVIPTIETVGKALNRELERLLCDPERQYGDIASIGGRSV